MRMTPETRDDVAMRTSLGRRVFQDLPELRGRADDEFFGQRNRTLLIRKVFGMAERKKKEGLLPRCLQSRVVTILEARKRQPQRFRIVRERLRRVPVE